MNAKHNFDLGIRFGVWIICVLIWTIIGFLFWLPLLLRSIINYTVNLTIASLKPSSNIASSERALEFAMSFYSYGFQRISRTMRNEPEANIVHAYQDIDGKQLLLLLREVIFAAIFWGIAFIWTGVLYIDFDALMEIFQNLLQGKSIQNPGLR